MKLPACRQPSSATNRRSELLRANLIKEISKNGGHLSFARFMESVLYTPGLGYYNQPAVKIFGQSGDFVTAPELSPHFAHCLARACLPLLASIDGATIAEFGAGSGALARDLLPALEAAGQLPARYVIIEPSPALRQQQATVLQAACPQYFSNICWLEDLPDRFTGIILANEVMDAMPFHCFAVRENHIEERCVAVSADGEFIWKNLPASGALLAEINRIQQVCDLPEGYQSEARPALAPWIAHLASKLAKGCILLSDYGYGRKEYYHPARTHGTLTCFHQHRQHDNPLVLPGLQDITAHVDFTAVAESADASGLLPACYTTQAAFLLTHGLAASMQNALSAEETYATASIVKTLTLPAEMGEIVKFMALVTDPAFCPGDFSVFPRGDRRHEL